MDVKKQIQLSEINSILQVLQSIVSKSYLSESKSEGQEIKLADNIFPVISCFASVINFVNEGSVYIHQGLVKQFLKVATILNIVNEEDVHHEEEEGDGNEDREEESDDEDHEEGDDEEEIREDLWWDESIHQYQLYWGDGDDYDEKVFSSEEDENDYSVAHRVKVRRSRLGATAAEEVRPSPPATSPSPTLSRRTEIKPDPVITALLRTIHRTAPKYVFNVRRAEILRQERAEVRITNVVPDEFRTIWDSAKTEDEVEEVNKHVPDPYPTLDWSKVNSRFLNNIPQPVKFPIQGCSLDPAIYECTERVTKTTRCGEVFTNKEKVTPKFEAYGNPFGSDWGYRTSAGIISVSSVIHHGYIWDDGNWILHAMQPREDIKKSNKEQDKLNFHKKVKGKKEPQRSRP